MLHHEYSIQLQVTLWSIYLFEIDFLLLILGSILLPGAVNFYQRLATVIYDDTAVNRPKYLNIFPIHFQHRYQHHHRCWCSLRNVHFNELSTYIQRKILEFSEQCDKET